MAYRGQVNSNGTSIDIDGGMTLYPSFVTGADRYARSLVITLALALCAGFGS
jgi:hypothetical protein